MIEQNLELALGRVEERFAEIDRLLAQPDIARDPGKLRDLSRERSRLARTVDVAGNYRRLRQTIAEDRDAIASGDPALAELAPAELPDLAARAEKTAGQLKTLVRHAE